MVMYRIHAVPEPGSDSLNAHPFLFVTSKREGSSLARQILNDHDSLQCVILERVTVTDRTPVKLALACLNQDSALQDYLGHNRPTALSAAETIGVWWPS
jgi:hypothetical protein